MVEVEGREVTIDIFTLTNNMTVFRWSLQEFQVTKEFISRLLEENKAYVDNIDKCNLFGFFKAKDYVQVIPIKIVSDIPYEYGYRVVYKNGKINEGRGY
jgi:hypothetical protein